MGMRRPRWPCSGPPPGPAHSSPGFPRPHDVAEMHSMALGTRMSLPAGRSEALLLRAGLSRGREEALWEVLSHWLFVICYRLSVIGYQLSAISYWLSVIGYPQHRLESERCPTVYRWVRTAQQGVCLRSPSPHVAELNH